MVDLAMGRLGFGWIRRGWRDSPINPASQLAEENVPFDERTDVKLLQSNRVESERNVTILDLGVG